MPTLKTTCLGAVSSLGFLTLASFSHTAIAQDSDENLRLSKITVTAQQIEEDLQEVPVSVTTVPEELLNSMFSGGEDILALAARVPGVYAESSNGRAAPRFYIRGLGNTDFDLAASQPVSIIMDDIVMENVALKSTPLFDLERVEVLRGPQGTLFGRNTTAGIIKFTSAKPTQELDAYVNTTYGSYNTFTLEGALGGPIIEDKLAARASVLHQRRDDWIDNTETAGGPDLGEFSEKAARLQLLYTPTANFSALLNAHMRDLDGTAAIFRANVLTPGSNSLNENYDRDRVSFNQGADNFQGYQTWGASAKLEYDLGPVLITSITGYEAGEGSSEGDIDGGVAGVGPGFIPFDAYTRDSLRNLNQTTQELRFTSQQDSALFWQAGLYYFDSSFDVLTVGPAGFPFPTRLTHENTSYAAYGQASYDLSDALKVTGGLRYTNDEKDLTVDGNLAQARNVSDDHLSWELSAMFDLSQAFSLYARVADGFRGPSIQGRDVAFFADPSVAESETILSYELGWKLENLERGLRFNGAFFAYDVQDIQLTAVGGDGNSVQLINADEASAYGVEFDVEYAPTDNLVFTGGFAFTETELNDEGLAVGTCAQCTVLDSLNDGGFALIDGNPFPNAPEIVGNFTARYAYPLSEKEEIFFFTDWSYQGETNIFLYESAEFNTDDQYEGGLKIGYKRLDSDIEFAFFGRNITDEDNIKGGIDFNNNTAFVNEPRIWGISLRMGL